MIQPTPDFPRRCHAEAGRSPAPASHALPRLRPVRWTMALLLLLSAAALPLSARAQQGTAGVLGQVPADYELHSDLVFVSGQLVGFREACGFGRRPDREELLDWYRHHRLARNERRLRTILDLGAAIGREGPCTDARQQALVSQWDSLMSRTRAYVAAYR